MAHDAVVNAVLQDYGESRTEGGNGIGRLQILLGQGGGGKSFTINSIITTLIQQHSFDQKNYRLCATTGKAATVINGSTVHSVKEGMALPVGRTRYKDLQGIQLREAQERYADLKLLVIDEFTMLRQKELYYIDERLKQIKCNTSPFGGIVVLLVGDPAQLPPVQGDPLWAENPKGDHNMIGYGLFQLFDTVVELVENNRLDRTDPRAVEFYEFLQRLRDGKNTHEDWVLLREQCSRYSKGFNRWREEGFDSPDCVHLYCTNSEVQKHNAECITKLEKPIAYIHAKHTGDGHKYGTEPAHGLESSMYLSVGSRVLMTNNVCQRAGLCNGSTGTVKEIVYSAGSGEHDLPLFVLVDFGSDYTGPSFFPRDHSRAGWIPVHPIKATWYSPPSTVGGNCEENTRTMLPLRLCWAWTVWKAQGQTIRGKVSLSLGRGEKEHGLTYVAMSRVTRFSDIGLYDGITKNRLCTSIQNHKKMKPRIQAEQRLRLLFERTKQFIENNF